MRTARPSRAARSSARLRIREIDGRRELWTETVGSPPAVYGERWRSEGDVALRSFEPARSKLAAAVAAGWDGPLPATGESWLYLGAASGTTASHVADLVGPTGRVYAIERSLRPFARLLAVAQRWPNLLPVLGDARQPERYADRVPLVAGVYADVAQPDQAELVRKNLALFADPSGGAVLVALKTSSMGRDATPAAHARAAAEELGQVVELTATVRLSPYYRSHFLLGGRQAPAAGPTAETVRRRNSRTERSRWRPPRRGH